MWGIITNLEYLLFFWINLKLFSLTHSLTHPLTQTPFFFNFFNHSHENYQLWDKIMNFFSWIWRREILNLFDGEQLLGFEVATQSKKEDDLKQPEKFQDWATKRLSDLNWCVPFPKLSLLITYDTFINSYHHWVKMK